MTEIADSIIHFETLFEQAEKVSIQTNKSLNDEQILDQLLDLISTIKQYYKAEFAPEIKSALIKRSLGEILFFISTISMRENIDVYSALKDEIHLQEMDLLPDNKIITE